MMRQAGRSLPAYREFRRKHSFKEVAGTPELCAEVTLMPLDDFPVDAAIIFADIMTPVACLGVDYEIVEGMGPMVADPIRSIAQVERLAAIPAAECCRTLFDAMRLVAERLDGEVPMIGFAGAPFTLASYLVEGKPNAELTATRALMKDHPEVWHGLLDAHVRRPDRLHGRAGQGRRPGTAALRLLGRPPDRRMSTESSPSPTPPASSRGPPDWGSPGSTSAPAPRTCWS